MSQCGICEIENIFLIELKTVGFLLLFSSFLRFIRTRYYLPLEPKPTQPRASTREQAVVGVAGAVSPMNERRRLPLLKVDTRGVGVG